MKRLFSTGSIFLYCFVCLTVSTSIAGDGPPSDQKVANEKNTPGCRQINTDQSGGSDFFTKFGLLNQICSGVNIHFTSGHKKDLDMIAAGGFKFIRMDFAWEDIERKKGNYDWSDYDELVADLGSRGMGAIFILDYSNSLYEEPIDSKDPLTGKEQKDIASPQHPGSVAAFARWAAASAVHFKSGKIIWEIWNEPNIFFWKPKPDVAQYIELAMSTCKAIKAVVPDATIIGPATSEVPLPFLESFLASGVLEYLDAVSVHPYRNYSKSPETASVDYQKLRELIEQYAPEVKRGMPVISSEWGYSSSTKGVSPEKQEAYIVRMQLSNLLNGIPLSIWYDWKNDGDDPAEHEQNFGTVTSKLVPKPAYSAIQTMNKQLQGFTFLHRIIPGNENDFILLFKNDQGRYKLSAWTTGQRHSVLSEISISDVESTKASDGRGNALKPGTEQGRLVLNLDALPQYITLPPGIVME